MTIYLTSTKPDTPLILKEPLVVIDPDANFVIRGTIISDSDITIRVNNFILFGEIITKGDLSIDTVQDIFALGKLEAANITITPRIHDRPDDEFIENIRRLNINICHNGDGSLLIDLPQLKTP